MKVSLIFLIVVLAVLQHQFWIGDGGLVYVWNIQKDMAAQRKTNHEYIERNQSLQAEVIDLKQGLEAIEEHGRHDLGLIKPGETFYQIVDKVK